MGSGDSNVDNDSLVGKVALITGAGRGIGRAEAIRLSRRGIIVVVNDLGVAVDGTGTDTSPAQSVVSQIEAEGGRAIVDHTDVGSLAGGEEVVRKTVSELGRIDILINNAGFVPAPGDVERPIETDVDAQLDIHFKAALGTISAAIPWMKNQRFGRIINTVSEVALDSRYGGGTYAYAAAKAALWSLTLSMSSDFVDEGITVNAISPGAATRMNATYLDPSRTDLAPDHVAQVVEYLICPSAGDLSGRVIHVAGDQLREFMVRRTADSGAVRRIELFRQSDESVTDEA
ncbi:SDR family NAD(P)-dependent oxidoreductase [Gordonia insulae]|nr:SDR family NAD(P)-dependent oxidoreductase [Gordonia insulae]